MGTFIIIVLVLITVWPIVRRWVAGFVMRRAEDHFRRMAGQPGRREERRQRGRRGRESEGRTDATSRPHPARAMNEVAEDVEFVEIKEFSETTVEAEGPGRERRIYRESQVEDVKFTEIKDK